MENVLSQLDEFWYPGGKKEEGGREGGRDGGREGGRKRGRREEGGGRMKKLL